MKKINNPKRVEWLSLCERPFMEDTSIEVRVMSIMNEVREKGDTALKFYLKEFSKADVQNLMVSTEEFELASTLLDENLKAAIQLAKSNLEKFHSSQAGVSEEKTETSSGVLCWRKSVGIEKVGLYIPGGTAPLFSTVLMLGIPANLAGCKDIVLCTPPYSQGQIHPAILYTAQLLGITKVYKSGGAEAIAAMTFGTESIPKVSKIFGPGNRYVTQAKQKAQNYGVAIDMPAGPSEVLVIADESSIPAFVAADLLAQAEHGEDSQVILLSNSEQVLSACAKELLVQIEVLPRKDIARKALANSREILLDNLDSCIAFSNEYAPEHLILATSKNAELASKVINAGSVFMGNFSCESLGDYASGTNHTLPTSGYAKAYSGVSVASFQRQITFQEVNPLGIQNLGPAVEIMAKAEGLFAHKNAVTIRLKSLK
jgi:histidinol dehydrogenase